MVDGQSVFAGDRHDAFFTAERLDFGGQDAVVQGQLRNLGFDVLFGHGKMDVVGS